MYQTNSLVAFSLKSSDDQSKPYPRDGERLLEQNEQSFSTAEVSTTQIRYFFCSLAVHMAPRTGISFNP